MPCHNPVGVGRDYLSFTQGSSFLATPGWMMVSLWDRFNALANFKTSRHFPFSSFILYPSSFHVSSPRKSPQIRSAKFAKTPAKSPIVNRRQP
jgi:hypothetical protein